MPSLPTTQSPSEPVQTLSVPASAIRNPRTRNSASLLDGLPSPHARVSPSRPSTFEFAPAPEQPDSRPQTPSGRIRRTNSRASSGSPLGRGRDGGIGRFAEMTGDPLGLVTHSYVPHVAVYASQDADDLANEKGIEDGIWKLFRPFGEHVPGKVTVRDSNGSSKTFDDFSVRFFKFNQHGDRRSSGAFPAPRFSAASGGESFQIAQDKKILSDSEAVVGAHLASVEDPSARGGRPRPAPENAQEESPAYSLYLRRLLCGVPLVPHETFAHPVACVVVISSRSRSPIEELRRLYAETSGGETMLPAWVDSDYLRYYVLVHDEERDDISRSTSLFDQMKRHFGLHCHLLRIRSTMSVETDDDSIPLPRSLWISAAEDLASPPDDDREGTGLGNSRYIFDSDATAIRAFVREMVTQSIVPTMERHIGVWNDQVASRRRGITGRFISLSRKWAGLGTGSGSRPSSMITGPMPGAGNYDASGFYRAATPEATMRRLADFAFMLRDWKLAHSTYDLLRHDFSDAKAWKYHAAANEMAAISLLIIPQSLPPKSRSETVDQMLDAAFYSYHTRCGQPYGAVRALVLGMELLKLRGGFCVDDAVRWGTKLLESKLMGTVGDPLMKERLAICYEYKQGLGSRSWGARKRKSAAWWVLAADAWARQGTFVQARRCLGEANRMYGGLPNNDGIAAYAEAHAFLGDLQHRLGGIAPWGLGGTGDAEPEESDDTDEQSESLGGTRGRRLSTIGHVIISAKNLETEPLHGDGQTHVSDESALNGYREEESVVLAGSGE